MPDFTLLDRLNAKRGLRPFKRVLCDACALRKRFYLSGGSDAATECGGDELLRVVRFRFLCL
jgi:hypothetical protein